jgi:hypothetical protein
VGSENCACLAQHDLERRRAALRWSQDRH